MLFSLAGMLLPSHLPPSPLLPLLDLGSNVTFSKRAKAALQPLCLSLISPLHNISSP